VWSMHGSRVGRSLGNKAAKARKFLLSGNGERFRAVHPQVSYEVSEDEMRRPYNRCEAVPEVAANRASVHKPNFHSGFSDRGPARRPATDVPQKDRKRTSLTRS
jgi:molecular chaperone DnaK (HSP70)